MLITHHGPRERIEKRRFTTMAAHIGLLDDGVVIAARTYQLLPMHGSKQLYRDRRMNVGGAHTHDPESCSSVWSKAF